MENYIYKQNTGVLSKNQNLITNSKVIFKVQNIYLIDSSNFRYDCYKCNDCYRLEIYLDNPNVASKFKVIISACDYQMWVHLNKEYVYKDRGSIVIDLNKKESNKIIIDLKISKGNAITLSLEDFNGNKKTVAFIVK